MSRNFKVLLISNWLGYWQSYEIFFYHTEKKKNIFLHYLLKYRYLFCIWFNKSDNFLQWIYFMMLQCKSIEIVWSILQVADVLILMHSLAALDEYADKLLSVVLAHALPTTIHVVQVINYLFKYVINIFYIEDVKYWKEDLINIWI